MSKMYQEAVAVRDECLAALKVHNLVDRDEVGMEMMEWVRINRALIQRRNAASNVVKTMLANGTYEIEDIV